MVAPRAEVSALKLSSAIPRNVQMVQLKGRERLGGRNPQPYSWFVEL